MTKAKGRREWRVVWMRQGNTQPRSKKVGTSEKRAHAYLAAVLAASPEERYGDKVDKPWHCDGGDGFEPCYKNCDGQTNRKHWDETYADMAPIIWARIESRPVNPWEEAKAVAPEPTSFGDVIVRGRTKMMVVGGRRAVIVNGFEGYYAGQDEPQVRSFGIGQWEKADD